MATVAVLANAGLTAFTGATRFWIFAAIILFKILVATFVPDVTELVKIQLQRQAYFNDIIRSKHQHRRPIMDNNTALNVDEIDMSTFREHILDTDDDP